MKIAIGSDHGGFKLKEEIKKLLKNHEVIDLGTFSEERCDFPEFGIKVAKSVSDGIVDRGILVCTTGSGMTVVANKFKNVLAVNIYFNDSTSLEIARQGREHLDCNLICLSGKFLNIETVKKVIEIFLNTPKLIDERYQNRIEMIRKIESQI